MVKTVQGIEQKQSANGKSYYTVTWTDGTSDNIFEDAMYRTLVQAAEKELPVTITKKQNPKNPKYFNVESITLGGEPTGVVPPAPAAAVKLAPPAAPPPVTSRREDSIEAQSDMKAAVELLKMVPWPPTTKVSTILKVLPITYHIVKQVRNGGITPSDEDVLAILIAKEVKKE